VEPAEYLAALEDAVTRTFVAADGTLDLPVPSCPGWSVSDLVAHLGRTWGWAATIVTDGSPADRPEPPDDAGDAALVEWARGQAARLVTALGSSDAESGCWTFGQPATNWFWFRRQALETVLHAWDAERATGTTTPLTADLAADGLDEHLTVMVPRWMGRNPGTWGGETFHFHRTDGDGEWLVHLGPESRVEVEHSHAKGDIALRGGAEALWLWCTNRETLGAAGIDVFGERALAERWSSQITF